MNFAWSVFGPWASVSLMVKQLGRSSAQSAVWLHCPRGPLAFTVAYDFCGTFWEPQRSSYNSTQLKKEKCSSVTSPATGHYFTTCFSVHVTAGLNHSDVLSHDIVCNMTYQGVRETLSSNRSSEKLADTCDWTLQQESRLRWSSKSLELLKETDTMVPQCLFEVMGSPCFQLPKSILDFLSLTLYIWWLRNLVLPPKCMPNLTTPQPFHILPGFLPLDVLSSVTLGSNTWVQHLI